MEPVKFRGARTMHSFARLVLRLRRDVSCKSTLEILNGVQVVGVVGRSVATVLSSEIVSVVCVIVSEMIFDRHFTLFLLYLFDYCCVCADVQFICVDYYCCVCVNLDVAFFYRREDLF